MIEVIGYIGAIAFSVVNVPLAISAHKTKDTKALPWSFMILWFIGNNCFFIYSFDKGNIPLALDYGLNFFIVCYIIYIKRKYPCKM